MTFENEVNPPLEEYLEHHGVKGMKWGVRKKRPSTSDIHNARVNVHDEKKAIRQQARKARRAKTPKGKENAKTRLADLKAAHLKNPDRVTALHLTKGEHAVAAALLLHPVTAAPTAAHLVTNELTARAIARKQRRSKSK